MNLDDEMEIECGSEQSKKKKVEALQALVDGPLASAVAKLNGSSRGISSNEDFHFYYNFPEFKAPVKEMAEKSKTMLKDIGSSKNPWGKPLAFPDDLDDSYDWLGDRNDEVFEKIDASVEEFQRLRKKEEESGREISSMDCENGFQLVSRKNKKGVSIDTAKDEGQNSTIISTVKMASKDRKVTGARPQVPFHIPTIPRPQDEFRIVVNNSNNPFEHVWLQKSEDGSKFIHPLEKLSELDFVDRNNGDVEPVKPLPLESTPFKLVEEVKDLKGLAAKLRDVNEFAFFYSVGVHWWVRLANPPDLPPYKVLYGYNIMFLEQYFHFNLVLSSLYTVLSRVDLEHNHYRSFQGMTCLMQISTRTEDFVIDTLKLRVHIGPYLREVFKDPSKRKVMHGADHDIKWLQRDFGIYVCNLFDTGQASRLLQMERNSLEYLLFHFCAVTANKEYQNADWRIRPIPEEMLRYAREDTHYLLHIYDLMKGRLQSASDNGEDLLLEVYKRSCAICMQLYKKELLTETSYLHIYGLQGADFNSQQLAIVAGLCEWRDIIARSEDESTGYILPNRTLLEIARQMPITTGKLRRLMKSKHPYVERHSGTVVSIIRSSIQNADAFESAAEQLKERAETALRHSMEVVTDEFEALTVPGDPTEIQAVATQPERVSGEDYTSVNGAEHEAASLHGKKEHLKLRSCIVQQDKCVQARSFELSGKFGDGKEEQDTITLELSKESTGAINMVGATFLAKDVPEATVQVLKKPNRAFGAMLGNMGSKRKLDPNSKDKAESKIEQIKSSVTLPFHSFLGSNEQFKPLQEDSIKPLEVPLSRESEVTKLEEIIPLESEMNNHESSDEDPSTASGGLEVRVNGSGTGPESVTGDEMSELYSGFRNLHSENEKKNKRQVKRSQESEGFLQLKPFDYVTAREQVRFGEVREEKTGTEGEESVKNPKDSKERRKKSASSRLPSDGATQDFQQPRRRQAFPQSGNRSTTFR